MPKKIGVITIHKITNFGSALQSYATCKVIEALGYEYRLIDYLFPADYHIYHARGEENRPLSSKVKIILRKYGLLMLFRRLKRTFTAAGKVNEIRERKFIEFIARLQLTPEFNWKKLHCTPPVFDIYLTGSDQTWNPRYLYHDYSFLLDFTPEDAPRIAYAASFGATGLAKEYRQDYSKLLKRYDRISLRETSGIPLITELTGKEAVFCLDPTFLLDRQDWKVLIQNRHHFDKPYILCYIADYVFSPYPYVFDVLKKIREMTGWDLVFVGSYHKGSKQHGTRCVFDAGPLDFLELYDKAAFVVSSSFHGTAFAINFQKDFLAILNPSPSCDDRIENLLKMTGLVSRGLRKNSSFKPSVEYLKTDYRESNKCLEKLRTASLEYLRNALAEAAGKRKK